LKGKSRFVSTGFPITRESKGGREKKHGKRGKPHQVEEVHFSAYWIRKRGTSIFFTAKREAGDKNTKHESSDHSGGKKVRRCTNLREKGARKKKKGFKKVHVTILPRRSKEDRGDREDMTGDSWRRNTIAGKLYSCFQERTWGKQRGKNGAFKKKKTQFTKGPAAHPSG